MKVQDQFAALPAVTGHPILHGGMFFATLFIGTEITCGHQEFGWVIHLLKIAHGFNALRLPIQIVLTQLRMLFFSRVFGFELIERILGFYGVLAIAWAIILAHDQLFFANIAECSSSEQKQTIAWICLEITAFYTNFVANVIFIGVSNLRLRETGIMFLQTKSHRIDFLTKYSTMYGLFQAYFSLTTLTATAGFIQYYLFPQSNAADVMYVPMLIFLVLHVAQFTAVSVQFFTPAHLRTSSAFTLHLSQMIIFQILPVLVLIFQAFLVFYATELRESLIFLWIIADFGCLLISALTYHIFIDRLRNEHQENATFHEEIDVQEYSNQNRSQILNIPSSSDLCQLEKPRLQLTGDYYALTFCTFFKYYRKKYSISHEEKSVLVTNVMVIFTFQVMLIVLIYLQLTQEKPAELGSISMTMMHADVLITRLICAILMHLKSEPEVRQAMGMFKYVLNHAKVKIAVYDFYDEVCKQFKTPNDFPPGLTKINRVSQPKNEDLDDYFTVLKHFQTKIARIRCHHALPTEVTYLLKKAGQVRPGNSTQQQFEIRFKKEDGQIETRTQELKDIFQDCRQCEHDTFTCGELEEIMKKCGYTYSAKKSHTLFYDANLNNDSILDRSKFKKLFRAHLDIQRKKRRHYIDLAKRIQGNGVRVGALIYYYYELITCCKKESKVSVSQQKHKKNSLQDSNTQFDSIEPEDHSASKRCLDPQHEDSVNQTLADQLGDLEEDYKFRLSLFDIKSEKQKNPLILNHQYRNEEMKKITKEARITFSNNCVNAQVESLAKYHHQNSRITSAVDDDLTVDQLIAQVDSNEYEKKMDLAKLDGPQQSLSYSTADLIADFQFEKDLLQKFKPQYEKDIEYLNKVVQQLQNTKSVHTRIQTNQEQDLEMQVDIVRYVDNQNEGGTYLLSSDEVRRIIKTHKNILKNMISETTEATQHRVREIDALEEQDLVDMNLGMFICENVFGALSIATLQFVAALLTEIMNLILINGQKSSIDTVMNFVAFMVVSEIDDIYAQAQSSPAIEKIKNSDPWQPKIVYDWVPFDHRNRCNQVLFCFLKFNKLIFNSFYFYFFPFLVLVLNYSSTKCEEVMVFALDGSSITDQGIQYTPLCASTGVFWLRDSFTALPS